MNITRRKFIQAGAAAALVPLAGVARADSDPIRFAVIGCRSRGAQVAQAFIETGRFYLNALCDCDDASFDRAMLKLRKYQDSLPCLEKDFRRVLDDPAIDAVVIATPDHWHAAMTIMALDAGKHVYVEKPASFNIADGAAMVAAAERHPELAVAVGSQQRSGEHFRTARELIKSGALGKIGFCRAWITHTRGTLAVIPDSDPPPTLDYDMWVGPAPFRPYNANRCQYNWRFAKDFGTGEMGNWGAHWIDIVRWFMDLDLPISVMGTGGTYVEHDAKEWPDTQTVLYEYPDLTLLWEQRLWTPTTMTGHDNGAEFQGENGTLTISREHWTFTARDGGIEYHTGSELMSPHANNFAAAVREKAAPAASIQEGVKTALICHLGNIAVETRRKLILDPATLTFKDDAEADRWIRRDYREPWRGVAG